MVSSVKQSNRWTPEHWLKYHLCPSFVYYSQKCCREVWKVCFNLPILNAEDSERPTGTSNPPPDPDGYSQPTRSELKVKAETPAGSTLGNLYVETKETIQQENMGHLMSFSAPDKNNHELDEVVNALPPG